MWIKLQFKRKDNGVVEEFELHPSEVVERSRYIATMNRNGKKYAWPFGSCNIYESENNVLCAKFIELEYLRVEYINM